jgi:hypothetical protein
MGSSVLLALGTGAEMMRKLSPRQQEVIDLMRAGWTLNRGYGVAPRLQRGLDRRRVLLSTFCALDRRGLLKPRDISDYFCQEYVLKDHRNLE